MLQELADVADTSITFDRPPPNPQVVGLTAIAYSGFDETRKQVPIDRKLLSQILRLS